MKFLALAFLALFSTGVSACAKKGQKCTYKEYLDNKTMCECNSGLLLSCSDGVLDSHAHYDYFFNCPKPKNGGPACYNGDCADCQGCGKKVAERTTPARDFNVFTA